MKKKEKNIIIVLLLLIFIIAGFFYFFERGLNRQDLFNKQVLPIENSVVDIQQKNKVSIVVLEKKYSISFQEGDTVYQVMKNLSEQKENNFSFGFKEYPVLGIFVDEINGFKGEEGKYWIYYVNDKEASIGVSNYIIENGDIISWKLK